MLNEPHACGVHAPLTRERRYKLRRLLVRLSESSKTLPASLFIQDVVSTSAHSVAGGSYADIFLAEHQGVKVALKRLRMFRTSGDDQCSKSVAVGNFLFCHLALVLTKKTDVLQGVDNMAET